MPISDQVGTDAVPLRLPHMGHVLHRCGTEGRFYESGMWFWIALSVSFHPQALNLTTSPYVPHTVLAVGENAFCPLKYMSVL